MDPTDGDDARNVPDARCVFPTTAREIPGISQVSTSIIVAHILIRDPILGAYVRKMFMARCVFAQPH